MSQTDQEKPHSTPETANPQKILEQLEESAIRQFAALTILQDEKLSQKNLRPEEYSQPYFSKINKILLKLSHLAATLGPSDTSLLGQINQLTDIIETRKIECIVDERKKKIQGLLQKANGLLQRGTALFADLLAQIDRNEDTTKTEKELSVIEQTLFQLQAAIEAIPSRGCPPSFQSFLNSAKVDMAATMRLFDQDFAANQEEADRKRNLIIESAVTEALTVSQTISDLCHSFSRLRASDNNYESLALAYIEQINESYTTFKGAIEQLITAHVPDADQAAEIYRRAGEPIFIEALRSSREQAQYFFERRTAFITHTVKQQQSAYQAFLTTTKEMRPNNLRQLSMTKAGELAEKILQSSIEFHQCRQQFKTNRYTNVIYFPEHAEDMQQQQQTMLEHCTKLLRSYTKMFKDINERLGSPLKCDSLLATIGKALRVLKTLEVLPHYNTACPADWQKQVQEVQKQGRELQQQLKPSTKKTLAVSPTESTASLFYPSPKTAAPTTPPAPSASLTG